MPEKSPIVKVAKRVCPAVITIVISKDLPKIEGFYMLPFGDQQLVLPKIDSVKKEKTKIGGGSGFIVSSDGHILTCTHVVGDPEAEYTVIVDPKHKYQAKVLAKDPLVDVAILKIEGENLPYLELGNSSEIEVGETVIAIGNPLGEFEDTLSAGIVSGLSRKITAYGGAHMKSANLRGLIQTDAAINPGNSGGPLVNLDGKAIGINTAVVMGAQNLGFAIPISYAQKILEEVKKYGRLIRPFLGARYVILTKEISRANNLPIDYGALIVRENFGEPAIIERSTAEKAGLKEYDVILEADKKKITEDNPLSEALASHKIGDEIFFKILRDGKEIDIKAKLEEEK